MHTVFAGRVTYSDYINGANLQIGVSSLTATDQEPQPWHYPPFKTVANATGRVIFGIDHNASEYVSAFNNLTVQLHVTSLDRNTSFNFNDFVDLTISFDPGANYAVGSYTNMSVFKVDGSHSMNISIIGFLDANGNSITNLSTLPPNIYIKTEVEIERCKQLDLSTYSANQVGATEVLPCSTCTYASELDIYWPAIDGAEEYDLEWMYVNDYDPSGNVAQTSDINYNFRNSATRVTVTDLHYKISLIYERGWILYRVRGAGRDMYDLSRVVYTEWVPDAPSYAEGTLDNYPANFMYQIGTSSTTSSSIEHEKLKNWQYNASFAEQGLKKETVTYFDGSLRNREAVTKSNTEDQSIVGETIYDNQGRPAIQVLPVPTGKPDIRFYENFNKNTSNAQYSEADFDQDPPTTPCVVAAAPCTTLTGAANYYSPDNPYKDAFQSYVPDATGNTAHAAFPFTQTEYTPDNTGRIRRQTGVGPDHQLGTGHETQYFYGQPEQIELDRLFGSEAGYFNHYKKNMVIDANGQISISYLDAKGKVIATALGGANPNNVDVLPSSVVNVTADFIKSSDPLFPKTNRYTDYDIIFTKDFLLEEKGDVQFDYNVTAAQYQAACSTASWCYDCIYNLTISVKDACGNELLPNATPTPVFIGNLGTPPPFDASCSAFTLASSPVAINSANLKVISMVPGNYTITKTLSINQEAIDYYVDDYIQQMQANGCLYDFNHFSTEATGNIDLSGCGIDCNDCETALGDFGDFINNNPELTAAQCTTLYNQLLIDCKEACVPANACQTFYETMLMDFRPGGQYAKYTINSSDGSASSTDLLSIFNYSNRLPRNTYYDFVAPASSIQYRASWREPSPSYKDPDGNLYKIYLTEVAPGVFVPEPDDVGNIQPPGSSDPSSYILPEHLADLSEFIDLYSSNPQWAQSLVINHPEYPYYLWCANNDAPSVSQITYSYGSNPSNHQITSDKFDEWLIKSNTFADAIISTADHPVLMDNTGSNITDPLDLLRLDPYFQSTSPLTIPPYYPHAASPYAGQGAGSRADMQQILEHYHYSSACSTGADIDIKKFVARAINCGNIYPSSSDPIYFPQPGGSNPCETFAANVSSTEQDKQWVMYKNLYLAEKKKIQQKNADAFAINYGPTGSGGYCGCVGNSNFTYSSADILSVILFWNLDDWSDLYSSEMFYLDPEQPCSYWTYAFYAGKTRRFKSNFKNYTGCDQDQQNQLLNDAHYNAYLQTGQCSTALDFQFLLNKLARNGKLDNGIDINLYTDGYPEFNENLYSQVRACSTGTSFIPYHWFVTSSSSTNSSISASFYEYNTTTSDLDVTLAFTNSADMPLTPIHFDWSYVRAVSQIRFLSFNTSSHITTFSCKIWWAGSLTAPTHSFDVTGTITPPCGSTSPFTFTGCQNDFDQASCMPSNTAIDLQNLFNQLIISNSNDFMSTSNVDLSTDYTSNIYSLFLTGRIIAPFSDPTLVDPQNSYNVVLTWSVGTTSSTTFTRTLSCSSSSSSCWNQCGNFTFSFHFDNPSPSFTDADIDYFDNITPDVSDPEKFHIVAYHLNVSGDPTTEPITVTVADNGIYDHCPHFDFGTCGTPEVAECNTPNHQLKKDFENFLDGVAKDHHALTTTTVLHFNQSRKVTYYPELTSLLKSYWGTDELNWDVTTTNSGNDYTMNIIVQRKIACPSSSSTECWEDMCTITLKYTGAADYWSEINRITDFTINTSNIDGGYYHDFTFRAYLNNSNLATSPDLGYSFEIQGTSCLPLLPCDPCPHVEYTSTGTDYKFVDFDANNSSYTIPSNRILPCNPTPDFSPNNGVYAIFSDAAYYCAYTCTTGSYYLLGMDHTNPNPSNGGNYYTVSCNEGSCTATSCVVLTNQLIFVFNHTSIIQGQDYSFSFWYMDPDRDKGYGDIQLNAQVHPASTSPQPLGSRIVQWDFDHQGVWKYAEFFWNSGTVSGNVDFEIGLTTTTNSISSEPLLARYVSLDDIRISKVDIHRCDEIPDPTASITIPYNDDCIDHLQALAAANAANAYNSYIETEKESIRKTLIDRCKEAQETFNATYDKHDYVYTLYYYDQAGNLIKTIPPEGVVPVTSQTDLDQIEADRAAGTHTFNTKHTLPTTYQYNSLNQLIKQSMPDNANIKLWEIPDADLQPDNPNFVANAAEFTDGCNGLMAGYTTPSNNGVIYATNDCGKTWAPVTSIGISNLKKVFMVPATNDGYAIGDKYIVKTTNSGNTWSTINLLSMVGSQYIVPYNDLYFTSSGDGVVVGDHGVVLIYSSSSTTWSAPAQLPFNVNITGVYSTSSGEIYVVTSDVNGNNGDIYMSSDITCANWVPITSIQAPELTSVQTTSIIGTGYAGGKGGTLLKTTDAGITWKAIPAFQDDVKDLHFNDGANTGCALTSTGEIKSCPNVTTGTWTQQVSGVTAMNFVDDNYGWAVGSASGTPFIKKTTDGGVTWQDLGSSPGSLPSGLAYTAVHLITQTQGFIAGNTSSANYIYYYDESLTVHWRTYATTTSNGITFSQIWFPIIPGMPLYGAGISSGTNSPAYKISISGGVYTTDNSIFSGLSDFKNFSFIATNGFCINKEGKYYETIDNGLNWSITTAGCTLNYIPSANTPEINYAVASGSPVTFTYVGKNVGSVTTGGIFSSDHCISMATDQSGNVKPLALSDVNFLGSDGYAVGRNGTILKTDNGADWRILQKQNTDNYNAVKFISNSDGVVMGGVGSGGNGKYLKTTSGGTNWTQVTATLTPASTEFTDISEFSGGVAFTAGKAGKVYSFAFSSGNFVPIDCGTIVDLYGITRSGTSDAIAVGDAGNIFKYSSSSCSSVTTVIPPVLKGLSMIDAQHGFAIADLEIYETHNGGMSWSSVTTTSNALRDIFCFKIVTSSGTTEYGFITGATGTVLSYDATNGWQPVTNPPWTTGDNLNHVFFDKTTNCKYGYIVGDGGKIFRVDNFPTNLAWSPKLPPSSVTANLNSIYFVGNVGYAVGASGTILKSDNFGESSPQSWTALTTGTDNWVHALRGTAHALNDVYFRDQMTGYVVGNLGTILKTTDGGGTWTDHSISGGHDLYAINFSGMYAGVVGGDRMVQYLYDESDLFSSQFWYDRLGRLIVSQNSKQFNKSTKAFSYTVYDPLGRITETGEIAPTSGDADIRAQVPNSNSLQVIHNTIKQDDYANWLADNSADRTEVTSTSYDVSTFTIPDFTQQFLRGRVADVTINEDGQGGYDHATHYSYDVHGNVKTLVQDNPDLDLPSVPAAEHRYKRTDYTYDLISGKVKEVTYQNDKPDQFRHRYSYDADNRITNVYTSKDNVIWDHDARYFYYKHGPLARTEIGNLKVQGLDYVYTLQGWIKGVNSNTLNINRDPGKDADDGGAVGQHHYTGLEGINWSVARDVFGYSLGYYDQTTTGTLHYNSYHNQDDYRAINSNYIDFLAIMPSGPSGLNNVRNDDIDNPAADAPNLYNGNIKHMVTALMPQNSSNVFVVKPLLTAYRYDQLNRITEMRAFDDISGNTWGTGSAADIYKNSFAYDNNGNIKSLQRYNQSGVPFDNLTYHYDDLGGTLRSNKLYHVNDNPSFASVLNDDIEDPGTAFAAAHLDDLDWVNTHNNYKYDEIGNLIKDQQEEIDNIEWTVSGKIKKIIRTSSSTKEDLEFKYDASGNRIAKIIKPHGSSVENGNSDYPDQWRYTFYVRDAQGNILSTYFKEMRTGTAPCTSYAYFSQTERDIYGSSRLGVDQAEVTLYSCPMVTTSDIYSRTLGRKQYELSNHLGNVLTTISDNRVTMPNGSLVAYYEPEITSVQDYYPFGMEMPARRYVPPVGREYRFGFNGKAGDKEPIASGGPSYDYGFRIYHPGIAKFLSVDPLTRKYPELTPFQFGSDNPIMNIDLDGLEGKQSVKQSDGTETAAVASSYVATGDPASYSIPTTEELSGGASEVAEFARWLESKMQGNSNGGDWQGNSKGDELRGSSKMPFGISLEGRPNGNQTNPVDGPTLDVKEEVSEILNNLVSYNQSKANPYGPNTADANRSNLGQAHRTGYSDNMVPKGDPILFGRQSGAPSTSLNTQSTLYEPNSNYKPVLDSPYWESINYWIAETSGSYYGEPFTGEKYEKGDTIAKVYIGNTSGGQKVDSIVKKLPPR